MSDETKAGDSLPLINESNYMLSRVADNLYWMSRYLERAEHTARLLDMNMHQALDQTPDSANQRWQRVLASLHASDPTDDAPDAYTITRSLTFDPSRSESIVSCIAEARENARQVREQISSEMWEQINRLYLRVRRTNMDQIWHGEPHEFFQAVKEGAHLFRGITDATLSHGQGWQFTQLGCFIERASATATLLDVHFGAFFAAQQQGRANAFDYLAWIGLLKSCTSFEAYCKVYTADIQPDCIAEFLLLNAESPRSVRFAADTIYGALQEIAATTGLRQPGRTIRLAGRLRASLDYGQVDEIMANNLHMYLNDIKHQCAAIHEEIYHVYIAYPAETVLAT
jgi:uncharacterized alpha-E superfamily protein